jgi:small subunit ribosomal protein S7
MSRFLVQNLRAVNSIRPSITLRTLTTEAAATTTTETPSITATIQLNETTVPNDSLVSQIVNTLMRDGKKARAQRLVSDSMRHLQAKTQQEPYAVLAGAIEEASPLLKLASSKKGSKVVHIPTALRERQRRRRAITWIIDASAKRNEKTFEERFAAEIYDVTQGTSSVLQKKLQQHKQALANRANAQVNYNTQNR